MDVGLSLPPALPFPDDSGYLLDTVASANQLLEMEEVEAADGLFDKLLRLYTSPVGGHSPACVPPLSRGSFLCMLSFNADMCAGAPDSR